MPAFFTSISAILVLSILVFRLRIYFFAGDPFGLKQGGWHARSAAFYAPMQRLLSRTDAAFLASHRGISPNTLRRFQSGRRKIFRQYLQCLAFDFTQISAALRVIMVHSDYSRSDLAAIMFQARLTFFYTVAGLEFRLALHALGVPNLSITAEALTGALGQMRQELQKLSMQPQAV